MEAGGPGPGIVLGQPPRHDGWKEGEALGRREGCKRIEGETC